MDKFGDTRRDEDAAQAASNARMRLAYIRLSEIREEFHRLHTEEAALRQSILDEIGVSPGVVVAMPEGRFQVISCEGDFVLDREAKLVYPAANVTQAAPEIKGGGFSKVKKWIRFKFPDYEGGFERPEVSQRAV